MKENRTDNDNTGTSVSDKFRAFVKNADEKRKAILRKINIVSFCIGLIYTSTYATFVIVWSLGGKLSLGSQIVAACLVGVYVVVAIILTVFLILLKNASANDVKKFGTALKFFRLFLKLLSIAISIAAIVLAVKSAPETRISWLEIAIIAVSSVMVFVQFFMLVLGIAFGSLKRSLSA